MRYSGSYYFILFEDEMQEKKFFAIFTILALKLAIAEYWPMQG